MWCNAGAMGLWGWVMMGAMWVVVGLVVLWAVGLLRADRGRPSAEEILDRRLATGEIGPDEYEERRRALVGPA